MRHILLLAALALLSACTERAPAPGKGTDAGSASISTPRAAAEAPPRLSDAGFGPIRFGMTLPQAEAAAGKASLPQSFDPACSMVRFATLPGLRFMVESGTVTRADADPGTPNVLGLAVGDTLAQLRARYPDAQVAPHKYVENGHTISVPSADGSAAIVLEEEGGKLTKIRAGRQPAVAYVETCG